MRAIAALGMFGVEESATKIKHVTNTNNPEKPIFLDHFKAEDASPLKSNNLLPCKTAPKKLPTTLAVSPTKKQEKPLKKHELCRAPGFVWVPLATKVVLTA